jgi:redox-sensitive bicupin YhaK (pirin superfamily)
VWDVRVPAGRGVTLTIPAGHTTAIAVFKGAIAVNGSATAGYGELLVLDPAGTDIEVAAGAANDAVLLLMSGVPIDEPIVGYGPFVMNTRQEIEAAVNDFNAGRFGRMPSRAAARGEVVGA